MLNLQKIQSKNTRNFGNLRTGKSLLGLLIILVLIIATVATVVALKPKTVCEKSLAYDIGNIDPRFGITPEKFLEISKDAENIWEEGTGLDLFTYKPGAKFKINLVFDDRQRKTIDERGAKESLETDGGSYEKLTSEYKNILSIQKRKLDVYEKNVSEYTEKLNKYNSEVKFYNKSGGAPENIYKRLESDRISLENTAAGLNSQQTELKSINSKISNLVSRINKLAGTYNTEVAKYNKAYGYTAIFDQGEYTGTNINIYQFDKISDLRLVLAHEFGHALHLDHVKNPTSIMYYLMDKQNFNDPKLSPEDINALKIECGIK